MKQWYKSARMLPRIVLRLDDTLCIQNVLIDKDHWAVQALQQCFVESEHTLTSISHPRFSNPMGCIQNVIRGSCKRSLAFISYSWCGYWRWWAAQQTVTQRSTIMNTRFYHAVGFLKARDAADWLTKHSASVLVLRVIQPV